jgi:mercuric ion transport protein
MSEVQTGRGALFTGGLSAILASTCCLGPLVLVTLGFSGAWIGNLTVLEPYRPIFIGAAFIARGKLASRVISAPFRRWVAPTRLFSRSWLP